MINTSFNSLLARLALLLSIAVLTARAKAETINTEMVADNWEFAPGKVEFIARDGAAAMHLLPGGGPVVLKAARFANGTIEYDLQPDKPDFVLCYFRRQNNDANEIVYFRTWNAGNPLAPGTLQYAPTIKGVNLWDMLEHYQTACMVRTNGWNHVKIIASGPQLRVFVNDMANPVLEVPQFEGEVAEGGLAFQGSAYYANLKIRPGEVEGLCPVKGIDPTHTDARYLRHWAVSQPQPLPPGRELTSGDIPKADATWEQVWAERRGLINLSRKFGKSDSRRVVWLKTKLCSATEQKRRVELGFSDEVWVFLNGRLAYVDKNLYGQPIMKSPEGRCALENAAFDLPLKAGENEVLVGLSNDFYGWGLVARFDDLKGLEFLKP